MIHQSTGACLRLLCSSGGKLWCCVAVRKNKTMDGEKLSEILPQCLALGDQKQLRIKGTSVAGL